MKRKEFIQKTIGAMFVAIPVLSVIACSDSDDNSPETPDPGSSAGDCLANGTGVTIGSNHGHTLTVSKEDVTAGVEKTYSIKGDSGHNHSVTLSVANFTSLKNKTAISLNSTNDSDHTHAVTVSCA